MNGVEERPCRRCKMKIVVLMGPNGNPIPLQRIRTVYVVRNDRVEKLDTKPELDAPMYVSHFETCPNANEFSRRRRES